MYYFLLPLLELSWLNSKGLVGADGTCSILVLTSHFLQRSERLSIPSRLRDHAGQEQMLHWDAEFLPSHLC